MTSQTDQSGHSKPVSKHFKWPALPWEVKAETLLLLSCLYFVAVFNLPFWRAAAQYQSPLTAGNIIDLVVIGAFIAGLHFLVLLPFTSRLTVKPMLAVLLVCGASASFYSWYYGTYFDVSMINNILETDYRESRDLMTPRLIGFIAVFAGVPTVALSFVKINKTTLGRVVQSRLKYAGAVAAITLVCALVAFQSFSTLMRNHKELRYLISPGNVLVSLPRALSQKAEIAATEKAPIGEDAKQVAVHGEKPLLLVLVIGETQRAANWGLNGYDRNTTPKLSQREELINFADVSSCGTSTAVSVPCMFSDQDHDHFSDTYSRTHESLLDVVQRAGVGVEWIDNQSGCKGVCDGVETDHLSAEKFPGHCPDGECLDEALIDDLRSELEEHTGNQLLVLHQMGNHGPAYFRRYPQSLRRFTPTCDSEDLSHCSREEVINTYDNATLYTDLVLDQILTTLASATNHDTALIYVSDHGESLGEMGVYLHGLPYMIAPEEQTRVPMFWWLSPGFQHQAQLDPDCLRAAAQAEASHDNLFHSILGLMNISTAAYNPQLDLSAGCRLHSAGALAQTH